MSALLVITAGHTDVQLVANGVRKEFKKDHCAEIHSQLESRSDWHLTDPPPAKASGEITELPPSEFHVCTPKLDAVLDYVRGQDIAPTHALVLDTRRDPTAERGDPRFAGPILERRLRERLGGKLVVWRTTYLHGVERLEDRSEPRDAVIRRDIVNRIDQGVRRAIQESAPARIVVATTGGMPVVTTLLEEVVRLHAGTGLGLDLVEVADGAKADPPTRDRAVPRRSTPEPSEGYRARRHALELIEGGHLLGAWGAVRHLHDDEVERRWTRVVEWLSRFAASLPIPEECDIDVLKHPRRAARAALRVEFALRARDIPRSIHGTVAFFEAALWDHLDSHLEPHKDKPHLFRLRLPPDEKLVRTQVGPDVEGRKRPFEVVQETGEEWYRIHDDDVCAIRLAKHYLEQPNLTQLGQAISKVRELRNDVAHNEPTPGLMADARRRMVEACLWSTDDTFLQQPLVTTVLMDCGVERSGGLCNDLIATVRTRLQG